MPSIEEEIRSRQQTRDRYQLEHRGGLAAELMADELTRIRDDIGAVRVAQERIAEVLAKGGQK